MSHRFGLLIDPLIDNEDIENLIIRSGMLDEPLNILDLTVSIVESYNHPRLGLCFDSGHANISPAGLSAVFDRMKENIVTCHLHDNDGIKDTHSAPGHGNIDWPALMVKVLNIPRLIHLETESREYSQTIWQVYERLL